MQFERKCCGNKGGIFMIINLSDNQKKAMKEAIHAYYLDER